MARWALDAAAAEAGGLAPALRELWQARAAVRAAMRAARTAARPARRAPLAHVLDRLGLARRGRDRSRPADAIWPADEADEPTDAPAPRRHGAAQDVSFAACSPKPNGTRSRARGTCGSARCCRPSEVDGAAPPRGRSRQGRRRQRARAAAARHRAGHTRSFPRQPSASTVTRGCTGRSRGSRPTTLFWPLVSHPVGARDLRAHVRAARARLDLPRDGHEQACPPGDDAAMASGRRGRVEARSRPARHDLGRARRRDERQRLHGRRARQPPHRPRQRGGQHAVRGDAAIHCPPDRIMRARGPGRSRGAPAQLAHPSLGRQPVDDRRGGRSPRATWTGARRAR